MDLQISCRTFTLEGTVFICGAMVMTFEIIGSRILSPYIGASTYVWTSLIGVILGSLSFGYWLGGRLTNTKTRYQDIVIRYIFCRWFDRHYGTGQGDSPVAGCHCACRNRIAVTYCVDTTFCTGKRSTWNRYAIFHQASVGFAFRYGQNRWPIIRPLHHRKHFRYIRRGVPPNSVCRKSANPLWNCRNTHRRIDSTRPVLCHTTKPSGIDNICFFDSVQRGQRLYSLPCKRSL